MEDHLIGGKKRPQARATESHIVGLIERLSEHIRFYVPNADESDIINAFCRTLCMGRFAESAQPVLLIHSTRGESLDYLLRLVHSSSRATETPHRIGTPIAYGAWGKNSFITKERHMGLALLGPLPLQWKGVEIYKDDIQYDFSFSNQESGDQVFEDPRLGQLLRGWRLHHPDQRADRDNWVVNHETGEQYEWPYDPRMTPEALITRGIALQDFVFE